MGNWNWPLIEIYGYHACRSLTAIALTAPSSKEEYQSQPRLESIDELVMKTLEQNFRPAPQEHPSN